MNNSTKNFLDNIRGAEEAVKRLWIGVFSAGAMVLVLGFWAFYGSLVSAPREVAVTDSTAVVINIPGTGNNDIETESRLALLSKAVKRGYAGIGGALKKSYNLKVEKVDEDFVYDGLKLVPPTLLP